MFPFELSIETTAAVADAPSWTFSDLHPVTRWVAAYQLPSRLHAPTHALADDEWQMLETECRRHRLDGLLVAAVASGALPATPSQRHMVSDIEGQLTRNRMQYDEITRPVLEQLRAQSIPFRLIKGSALPWSDYPDPQMRPTGDLDLLVPGSRLLESVNALEAIGGDLMNPEPTDGFAQSVFKGLTVVMPSGLEVDLHRLLSWGPIGVRVPEADLWSPGRTFDRLGTSLVTFDVERTLIHVCAHLLILGAIRASEVRDVAQLAFSEDLDAARAIAIAHRWGHEAILAVGLQMAARELCIDDHPLSEWSKRYRVTARDRLWLRIDQPDAPISGVEPIAVLTELRGLHARATFLKALIAPRDGTDPTFAARAARQVQRMTQRARH